MAPLRPARCPADTAYDSDALRVWLETRGCQPVIPTNPTRKRKHPFDKTAYRARHIIERPFCRLKDWRRIATRYDKLADNYLAAVALAAIVIYWLGVPTLGLMLVPSKFPLMCFDLVLHLDSFRWLPCGTLLRLEM